jgi:hypothetical protein
MGGEAVSHGPGRVQRAILKAIAIPEAVAPYDHKKATYPDPPGPVGAPLWTIYLIAYGVTVPTRSQRVSVDRAIRVMQARNLIDTYPRRLCPYADVPAIGDIRCPACTSAYSHPTVTAVGRLRTADENQAAMTMAAQAFARIRALR